MSCNCLGNTFINKDGQEENLTELMCVEIISKIPDCCDYFTSECLSVLYFDNTAISYEGCYGCPSDNDACCNRIQNLAKSLNPAADINCCSNFDGYCEHAYNILKNTKSSPCYSTDSIEEYYISNYFGNTGTCGATIGKASACAEQINCTDPSDPECIFAIQSRLFDSNSDCYCSCTENATSSGCMEYIIHRNPKCCNSWDSECDQLLTELTDIPGTPCFLQTPEARSYLIPKPVQYTAASVINRELQYDNQVLQFGAGSDGGLASFGGPGGPSVFECCCSSPDNPIYRQSQAQCCDACDCCDTSCPGCEPPPGEVPTYIFIDCDTGCIQNGTAPEGSEVTLEECATTFACVDTYQFQDCNTGCIPAGQVLFGSEQSQGACETANPCVDSWFCNGSVCESIKVVSGTEQGPEICTTCAPQTVTSFLCQGSGYDRQCNAVQVPVGTSVQTLEECQNNCTCANFVCDTLVGNCVATSNVYCPTAISPEDCEAAGCDPRPTCPHYVCNSKTGDCEFVGMIDCSFAVDQATCELTCNPALCDNYVCDSQTGNCFSSGQVPCAEAQSQQDCENSCIKDGGGGGCGPTICAVCDVNCGYTSYSGNSEIFAAFWSSPWAQAQENPECCNGPFIESIECPDGTKRAACVQLAEAYVSYTRFSKKKYIVEKDANGVYTNRKMTDQELQDYLNSRIRVPIAYTQGHCGGKCSSGGDPCNDFNNWFTLPESLNLNQACITNAPDNLSNCFTTFYDPNGTGGKITIIDKIIPDIAVAFNRTFSSGTEKIKQIDQVKAGIVTDQSSYIETPQVFPVSKDGVCTNVDEYANMECRNIPYFYGAANPPEGVVAFYNYPERQDTFNDDCCKFLATCREEVTNICAGSYNSDCEKRMSDICLERASRLCVTSGCDTAPESSRNKQDFVYYFQGVSAGNNCVIAEDDACSDVGDNKCFTYKKLDALDIDFVDTFGDPNRLYEAGAGLVEENRSPAQYSGTCFNNSASSQNNCIKVLQTLADNFSSSENTQGLLNYIKKTTGLEDGITVAFFKKCLCSYMDPHSRLDTIADFNNYPIDLYSGYYSNDFSKCRRYDAIETVNEQLEESGSDFRFALRGYRKDAILAYSCGDNDAIELQLEGFKRRSSYAVVGHQNGFIQPITLNPCLPCKGFNNFPVGEDNLGDGTNSNFIEDTGSKLNIVAYSPYVNYASQPIGQIFARMTLADQIKQNSIFYQNVCEYMTTLLCSGIEILHSAEVPQNYYSGTWDSAGVTLPKDRSERFGHIYNVAFNETSGRFPYQTIRNIKAYVSSDTTETGGIGGGIGVLGNHYGNNTENDNDTNNKITGERSSGMNPWMNNSFGILRVHKQAVLNGLSVLTCPLQFDALNSTNQRVDTSCNLPNNIVMGGMCWISAVITTEVWQEMQNLPDSPFSGYNSFVDWALDNEPLIQSGNFDATFFAFLENALGVLNYTVGNIPAEETVYIRKDNLGNRIYTLNDLLQGAKQIAPDSKNPGGCLEIPEEPEFGNGVFGTNGNCLQTAAGVLGGSSLIEFIQITYNFVCSGIPYNSDDPTQTSEACRVGMVNTINSIVPGCIDLNDLNDILLAIRDFNSNPCVFGYNNKTYRQMRV